MQETFTWPFYQQLLQDFAQLENHTNIDYFLLTFLNISSFRQEIPAV